MAAVDATLVARLTGELQTDLARDGRLGLPRRYLRGDHDLPYMPKGAKREYEHLAKRAVTNWTPLISDTFAKTTFVEGFRPARQSTNSPAWSYWQANGLDARQTIVHRGAFDYGTAYSLILPGTVQEKRVPFWRPLSPLKSAAWYADTDDEFPELALRLKGKTFDGAEIAEVFDRDNRYTFAKPKTKEGEEDAAWVLSATDAHGLGVTPFVRFRDRLDDEAIGVVRPLITLQNRVNEVVFSTLIALQYASFRQRWATGLAIPEDENGNPVEPFQAAVDRLWVSEDEKAKFGDFAQTELSGHHSAYDNTVRTLAAVAQVSPNILTGDLSNLSAEALAQMERATRTKAAEYKTIFGEAHESEFRLASLAAGDRAGASDTSASVRWRDTEPQSLAQTIDALGKAATMLSIPVEALWERIPDVSDDDIERWKSLREADPLAELTAELAKQAGAEPSISAPVDTGEDPAAMKDKFDALGSGIRAGAEPADVAARVGLAGIQFTGAMPVSLRPKASDAETLE